MVLMCVLASCVQENPQKNGQLYKEYHEFKLLVNSNNDQAAREKISRNYLELITEIDKKMPPELGFNTPLWKNLATDISSEYSHYEKIEGDKGCLTINGLNRQDRPISLSLYYIKESDNWVFNYFESSSHDSIREYYTEPTCTD